MRLAQFIRSHVPDIVEEWIDFAASLRPFSRSTRQATLRNAIIEMLKSIAEETSTAESPREQFDKARGRIDATGAAPSAAWQHGLQRLDAGLDINQVVAEFRVLRAVVIRLYQTHESINDPKLEEFVRFNEAIDQSIAETLAAYTQQLDKLRNTLLAVLAHDLRGPLQAITTTGEVMNLLEHEHPRMPVLAQRVKRAASRMTDLIDDFLTFLTPTIGGEIPIQREDMDMGEVCLDMVAEVNATLRTEQIHLQSAGNTRGRWDRARVQQILSNLLRNAVEHGAQHRCVTVMVNGEAKGVNVSVHNFGEPIPVHALNAIFKPLVQLSHSPASKRDHLGLGLFIAKELVERHRGRIGVTSSGEGGTTFHFLLPHAA